MAALLLDARDGSGFGAALLRTGISEAAQRFIIGCLSINPLRLIFARIAYMSKTNSSIKRRHTGKKSHKNRHFSIATRNELEMQQKLQKKNNEKHTSVENY